MRITRFLCYFSLKNTKKALHSRLFSIAFSKSFLSFHQQSYTLDVVRFWDSKGLGNLLRISYVSLTNLHTQLKQLIKLTSPIHQVTKRTIFNNDACFHKENSIVFFQNVLIQLVGDYKCSQILNIQD